MTEEFDHETEMAKLRAIGEQAQGSTREIAALCGAFYKELLEQGFIEEQAERLTTAWMKEQMQQAALANQAEALIESFMEQFGLGGEGA